MARWQDSATTYDEGTYRCGQRGPSRSVGRAGSTQIGSTETIVIAQISATCFIFLHHYQFCEQRHAPSPTSYVPVHKLPPLPPNFEQEREHNLRPACTHPSGPRGTPNQLRCVPRSSPSASRMAPRRWGGETRSASVGRGGLPRSRSVGGRRCDRGNSSPSRRCPPAAAATDWRRCPTAPPASSGVRASGGGGGRPPRGVGAPGARSGRSADHGGGEGLSLAAEPPTPPTLGDRLGARHPRRRVVTGGAAVASRGAGAPLVGPVRGGRPAAAAPTPPAAAAAAAVRPLTASPRPRAHRGNDRRRRHLCCGSCTGRATAQWGSDTTVRARPDFAQVDAVS